jgi:hypothetical protein
VPNRHTRSHFRNQPRVDPGVHPVRRPYLTDRSSKHSSYPSSKCEQFAGSFYQPIQDLFRENNVVLILITSSGPCLDAVQSVHDSRYPNSEIGSRGPENRFCSPDIAVNGSDETLFFRHILA